MNVTFFTAANDVPQHINSALAWTLTTLLAVSIIVFVISLSKRWQLPMIISSMLGMWFAAGTLLCCTGDSSFTSDWINSAVAIGTIGAVISSLYLANKKPTPFDYIKLQYLEITIWTDNHLSIGYEIINLTDFDIIVSEILIEVNGHKLTTSEFFFKQQEKTYTLISRKLFKSTNDYLYLIEYLNENNENFTDDFLCMLENIKNFKIHIITDVFHYILVPRKISVSNLLNNDSTINLIKSEIKLTF